MKRAVVLLISASLFVSMLVLGVVSKTQAQLGCSVATLNGPYGVSFTGFQQLVQTTPPIFNTTASFPQAAVGTITFDGAGGFNATATASNNGTFNTMSASGFYLVNPDCTGSILPPINAHIVIVDKGKELLFILTNPGAVQTGTAIRQ